MTTDDDNTLIIPDSCHGFVHNPELRKTFHERLRRSFPTIHVNFQADTYNMLISGSLKLNVEQCINYLKNLPTYKHSILVSYDNFPQTTITKQIFTS